MLSEPALANLARLIEPPDGIKLYAIIDGASVPNLLYLLEDSDAQHECLFAGELAPEVERAAPHLIGLNPQDELVQEWWREGWGEHWGIMLHAPVEESFKSLRRHFRRFLRVQLPDKRRVFFRFYDPRVFRQYLPTCNLIEANAVFGPVIYYFSEDKESTVLLRFKPGDNGVIVQKRSL